MIDLTPVNQNSLNVITLRHFIASHADEYSGEALRALQSLALAVSMRESWVAASFLAGGLVGIATTVIVVIVGGTHP